MKASNVPARLARLHSTSGGSSDTELNEFAVIPTGRPSGASAVITVTPVAKWPSARRKSVPSKPGPKWVRAGAEAAAEVGVSEALKTEGTRCPERWRPLDYPGDAAASRPAGPCGRGGGEDFCREGVRRGQHKRDVMSGAP